MLRCGKLGAAQYRCWELLKGTEAADVGGDETNSVVSVFFPELSSCRLSLEFNALSFLQEFKKTAVMLFVFTVSLFQNTTEVR